MLITLGPELEAALNEVSRREGAAPDVLAVNALRERFLATTELEPRDEWERGLLDAAQNFGVSLPNSALGSEGLYDYWPICWTPPFWLASRTRRTCSAPLPPGLSWNCTGAARC